MHTSESTKLREGVSNTFLHIAEISFFFAAYCSVNIVVPVDWKGQYLGGGGGMWPLHSQSK